MQKRIRNREKGTGTIEKNRFGKPILLNIVVRTAVKGH